MHFFVENNSILLCSDIYLVPVCYLACIGLKYDRLENADNLCRDTEILIMYSFFSKHSAVNISVLLVLFASFNFNTQVNAMPSSQPHPFQALGYVDNHSFSTNLKVHWSAGLPLVDVMINNKPYTFLFDSGAPTVIPAELLSTNDLRVIDTDTIFDVAGGKRSKNIYRLPLMSVGELQFVDFASDFSENFPVSCVGFDGIFGYNFMRDLVVTLNLNQDEIILSDKLPSITEYIKTEMRYDKEQLPKVRLQFPFGRGWFGLDTGLNTAAVIGDSNFIPMLKNRGYKSTVTRGTSSATYGGARGDTETHTFVLTDFSIDGKISIESAPFKIEHSGADLVGTPMLQKFSVIADFPNKSVYLKPTTDSPISLSTKNTFGFKPFWSLERGLFISAITDNTPAHQSDLEIGDAIVSINSEDTSDFDKDDFCNMLRQIAGDGDSFDTQKTLDIVVKKSGGEIKRIILHH